MPGTNTLSAPREPPGRPKVPGTRKGDPNSALLKLGLGRDIDLALHLPLRYEDETRIVMLRDCREGDVVQIEGTVTACEIAYRPRRQLVVTVDDESDTCVLRFFSFYPSQQKALAVGTRIRARGEIKGGLLGFQMVHPTCRPAGVELPQSLTPVYPTSASLPQAYLRKAVLGGLGRADLGSTFPPGFEQELGLAAGWDLRRALSFLHQPTPDTSLAALEDRSHPAWQRLKAEELLAQQLSQLQSKRERATLRSPALSPVRLSSQGDGGASMPLHEQLLAALPFQLTSAQRRVSEEIARDLAATVPMHRLLQGDVGSGKTIVAALGAAIAIDAGWQCALMAPTEILAQQHFGKLIGWLEPLLAPRGQRVAWLTGSQKKKERAEMLRLVASGEAALVIGTHAVIQDQVQFRRLALAIIDEQHRFGVAQRLALRGKAVVAAKAMHVPAPTPALPRTGEGAVEEPHLLMMSATPIPRTLAMSYYADLDVSTIDQLPPGRTPVVTKLVAESRRDEVVERIRGQLEQGRQVYWVCPLIEESEALDLTNATATHELLSAALPGVTIGLLHSRMAPAEKKAVMALFTSGAMGVLVSTTVIEVGVDVANASLMVIEHAERFGLSQLHQLRGRVGRGAAASACVLLYSTGDAARLGETARARLKAMVETSDGFEIARRDLEIRGPGEFMGSRQSGAPLLRFADLATDTELLEAARRLAPQMLDRHPALADRHVTRWLGGRQDYLKA